MNNLRPCIAFPSWGAGNAGYYGPACYASFKNPEFVTHSRTPWVRVWIRWDLLQPSSAGTNPIYDTGPLADLPGYSPSSYLAFKALEIQTARNAGKNVILQLHATPAWANQTTRAQGPNPGGRPNYMSPPWDTSTSSFYAQIVRFVASYFSPISPATPGVYIDFLEVCNEPNLEFWPPLPPSTAPQQLLMPYFAAGMLSTARWVTKNQTANVPVIMGPGLSDTDRTDTAASGHVAWDVFMRALLTIYPAYGTPSDDRMLWTMHNYGDVKYGSSRASSAVGILDQYGWNGYPSGGNSYIYLTEGGYSVNSSAAYDLVTQSNLVLGTWNRMWAAPRIGMMTNYQTWSAPGPFNDTGLCIIWPGGGYNPNALATLYERPVLAAWALLPTTYPR